MKRLNTVIILTAILYFAADTLNAQSKTFKLGQWSEIHSSIIKELNKSYVDTLPIDRMMAAGINAMLDELDPYTIYIPEEENENLQMMLSNTYGGIGAIIKKTIGSNVIINEPYENSPAHRAGLQCGDEILMIDGAATTGFSASESSSRMKGKPGTEVVFKVKKVHSGDTVDLAITRERIHLPDVEYTGILDDTTGYILQSGFTEKVSTEVRKAVTAMKKQGMKRLVLDLRGNGGGLMSEAVNIVSLFVPKGTLVVTSKGKTPGSDNEYRTTSEPLDTEIPVIVLIDSGSASSAEIVAGALQDLDRAVIMGTRSYGKGLVQSIRPLPYNGQMKVTTAKYYTPSGRCVQALDYTHRNEDGSIGHIADSLTKEFKTASGRIVKDGGGITPDVEIKAPSYSRLVYSLVLSGVVDDFVIDFAKKNKDIPSIDNYHFTDQDFEEFVKFAKTQDFDHRSSAQALYDKMKKELEEDGLAESMASELSALEKALQMDKERFLRLKKNEIIPFVEEEIATRYWFQEAGIKVRLRYDTQLKQALTSEIPQL